MGKSMARIGFFQSPHGYMAILFSSSVKPEILVVNEVSLGRLFHVKVRLEDFVVNFVNIYAPCIGAARVWFFHHMRRFMLTLPDDKCDSWRGF